MVTKSSSFFIFFNASAQESIIAKNPVVITGKLIKITKALSNFGPADKAIPDVKVRDEDGIIGKDEQFEEGSDPILYPTQIFAEDPALQKDYPSNPHKQSAIDRAITGNFAGYWLSAAKSSRSYNVRWSKSCNSDDQWIIRSII